VNSVEKVHEKIQTQIIAMKINIFLVKEINSPCNYSSMVSQIILSDTSYIFLSMVTVKYMGEYVVDSKAWIIFHPAEYIIQ
jgi:hypothetical protein